MGRSEKWSEPRLVRPFIANPDKNPELAELLREAQEAHDGWEDLGFTGSLTRASKEIILSEESDGPHLGYVAFMLDVESGGLSVAMSFDMFKFDGEDDLKATMAYALVEDVPIYPEDESAAAKLAQVYQSLFDEGFSAKDSDGMSVQIRTVFEPAYQEMPKNLTLASRLQPADVYLTQAREQARLGELVEAERVLSLLRTAIAELTDELDRGVRDENALQRILTSRPVLFGLNYRRIIPKHRLGGEYEMDYAAQTLEGLTDLIEIEASGHQLFTKAGNPRSALVHAEQQVLDWLQWMDEHHEYATSRWPDLMKPRGVVVIGRRSGMSEADLKRLNRRNACWGPSLQILTYDDLLERAEWMLEILTSPDVHESMAINDQAEGN